MLEADSDGGAVVRLVILFAVLPMAWGCVAVRPIESGKTLALARDEGILVVHINSAIPIEKLGFSSATAGSNLPAGEHFYLLGVTAGKYRWRDVVIPASKGKVHFVMAREDAWSFRVEPRGNPIDKTLDSQRRSNLLLLHSGPLPYSGPLALS